jgi:FkbM family methyltransferase
MTSSLSSLFGKHLAKLILKPDYRKTYFTLKKLRQFPRYQTTEAKLQNQVIRLADAASFVFMYEEIFQHQIYRFTTDRPIPRIIDGGANIGLSILYFKSLYPNAEIIAFEPDEKIFEILEANILNSPHSNSIHLNQKALWNQDTTLTFSSEGADAGRIEEDVKEDRSTRISAISLRPYLQEYTDFLKLDIEGAELEVIDDCKDLLRNVQHLFVEYHSFAGKPQRLAELLEIVTSAGFRFYLHPSVNSPQPLYQINTYEGMDSQVNIFAYRQNSGVKIL